MESLTGDGGEDTEPGLAEDVVQLTEHRDLARPVTSPASGVRAPVQQRPEIRLVHSHWSGTVQRSPAILCHKEPARASKAPY